MALTMAERIHYTEDRSNGEPLKPYSFDLAKRPKRTISSHAILSRSFVMSASSMAVS